MKMHQMWYDILYKEIAYFYLLYFIFILIVNFIFCLFCNHLPCLVKPQRTKKFNFFKSLIWCPFLKQYLWFAIKQHPLIKGSIHRKLFSSFLYDLAGKVVIFFIKCIWKYVTYFKIKGSLKDISITLHYILMPVEVTIYLLQILLLYFH